LLTQHGIEVRVHDECFAPDEADQTWLADCGRRGWTVITPDKRILRDPLSMKAIGANASRVFFLPKNNQNPTKWAPILIDH
jgi:hypothetical protein